MAGFVGQGDNGCAGSPTWSLSIRCVRGPAFEMDAAGRLTSSEPVAGQPVVADGMTGLEWANEAEFVVTSWQAALAHCEGLDWGGHTDWRLPDVVEARSTAIVSSPLWSSSYSLNVTSTWWRELNPPVMVVRQDGMTLGESLNLDYWLYSEYVARCVRGAMP
jgi:hypothetical protein